MTHMLRKHQNDQRNSSTGNPIHRDSRVISKIKPRIRIIHIFAPEIIQTDVANFRELVQRLTGKASSSPATTTTTTTTSTSSEYSNAEMARKLSDFSDKDCFGSYDDRDNGGGFLGVFEGLNDYFMQEMNESGNEHHPFQESLYPLSYSSNNTSPF